MLSFYESPASLVDASVIGGCLDEEFAPWSKGLMQDFLHGIFKPVLSEIVAAEIGPAPEQVRTQYAELLALERHCSMPLIRSAATRLSKFIRRKR